MHDLQIFDKKQTRFTVRNVVDLVLGERRNVPEAREEVLALMREGYRVACAKFLPTTSLHSFEMMVGWFPDSLMSERMFLYPQFFRANFGDEKEGKLPDNHPRKMQFNCDFANGLRAVGAFEESTFSRAELQRWVAAMSDTLVTEYSFGPSNANGNPGTKTELSEQRPISNSCTSEATSQTGSTTRRWTDEHMAELSEYREKYGTAAAARHFGITTARIRQLLPTERKKSQSQTSNFVFSMGKPLRKVLTPKG